jgi:hypothetical protein
MGNLEQHAGFGLTLADIQPERDRWLADFEDTESGVTPAERGGPSVRNVSLNREGKDEMGFTPVLREPSPRNPGQKAMIEVKTRRDGERTYVLCRSE